MTYLYHKTGSCLNKINKSVFVLFIVMFLFGSACQVNAAWYPTGPWRIHTGAFDNIFADGRSRNYFYEEVAANYPDHKYFSFSGKCSGGGGSCNPQTPHIYGKFSQVNGSCSSFSYRSECGYSGPNLYKSANGGFRLIYPTDTDNDGIADFEDNCVDTPNPPIPPSTEQADCDRDGKGDLCDKDNNILPLKTNISHGESIDITKCCGSNITWTVTSDDGVSYAKVVKATRITITAQNGHGNIYVTSESTDPYCNDTTIINVGCGGTCGTCQNINLNKKN